MIQSVELAVGVHSEVAGVTVDRHDRSRGQGDGSRAGRIHILATDTAHRQLITLRIAVVTKDVVAHRDVISNLTNIIVLGYRRIVHARHRDRHRGFVRAAVAVRDGVREGVDALLALVERVELTVGIVRVLSRRAHAHNRSRWQRCNRHARRLVRHHAALHQRHHHSVALRVAVVRRQAVAHRGAWQGRLGVILGIRRRVVARQGQRYDR